MSKTTFNKTSFFVIPVHSKSVHPDDETIKITIEQDSDELINKIKKISNDNNIKINMQHIDKYYNITYNDCNYILEAIILGNYNIINGSV